MTASDSGNGSHNANGDNGSDLAALIAMLDNAILALDAAGERLAAVYVDHARQVLIARTGQ